LFKASPDGKTYRGSKERYDQFNEDKIEITDNEFKASYAKFTDLQKRYVELIGNVAPNTDTGNTRSNIWNNELKAGEGEVTKFRRLYAAKHDDGEWNDYKTDAAASWIAIRDDFDS
jgi:hypothetical protein